MTQYNNQSQSIPVKPYSANDLTNQAADGHRSNQKLTEVSSGLQPNNELPEDVDDFVSSNYRQFMNSSNDPDDDSIQMAELYEQFRKELETLQTKGQE